ncbi:MAG TPA: glycosyl hydrolase family 18 protein, partial [Nocardioidaceae bacterium]|nr:glycosyl hydrolase family 18 protein [Nocardioidaceae bacterium]
GLKLLSAADVEQFVLSIESIVRAYGFDGIDWDLEQQNIFTVDNMLAATQRLKTRYGSDFIVTAAPAPSSVPYKVFAQRAGDLLDYIAPQYYAYADTNRLAGIKSRTAELVNTYGVPARKIGIGCKVGSEPYSAPAAFWRDAITSLRRSYPQVAGGMVWDATAEKLAGDTFAAVTVPALLQDATG